MTAALTAGQDLASLISELGEARRREPGDDLVDRARHRRGRR